MATDLATLAIRVENGDVVKATTALNSLTVAGGKSEAATQRLTRRMALLEIEARQVDAAMSKSASASARLASALGLSESAVGKLSAAFAAFSAVAVVGLIGRKTIEETELAQAAMAQLEAAVTSTGGAAGRTVAQLDALSLSLQKTTTFSDEQVKGAEAMLLTFDKIRGAEFDRATAAVTDLAARMGGDLAGAAVQVGKALQDPSTGLTALRRSGVSFSQSQIEVIRQLYATGQAAEGQRVILKELEHQFGGSAAAARDTLGGALAGLKNAWGDLFEVTRGASQGTVSGINAITAALENSGLSMNKILKDATVDWETMRASIQKVREIMSLEIGPGFLDRARNIIQRIDFDLNAKIAELNAPAKIGPSTKPPPITIDVDTKQATKDLEALQRATDSYYNSLEKHKADAVLRASAQGAENQQIREMIDATRQGEAAVDALSIAQAGANAVRELGVGVTEKQAAAVRREAEEHARLAIELGKVQQAQKDADAETKRAADEAEREMDRRARQLQRATSSAIEQGITDVVNGKNPLLALADGFKRAMIHAISEALAERFLASKFAAMLGIGVEGAAKKQDQAAIKMLAAAKLQDDAASKMLGAGGKTSTAGGIVIDNGTASSDSASKLKTAAQGFGVAVAGFSAGYQSGQATSSTSHSTFGNYARGALGGALSGAAAGAAAGSVFGPIGTAVGGAIGAVTGFVGGIFGAKKAMNEAAKAANEMRAALKLNMDALRNEVAKDALAGQIAQVEAQREQLRKQIEDAYSGGDKNSDTVRERNRQLAELNALENERIRQLKEEAGVIAQRRIEDYQERLDAATPGNEKAEAIAAYNRGKDRELEDLKRSFGSEIDATEAATLAVAQQAIAAEKAKYALEQNTTAINTLTTSLHNAPQGYKYQRDVFDFATPRVMPSAPHWSVPTTPFSPPRTPLNPPTLSSASTARPSITIAPVFQIDGTKTTRAQVQQIGVELRKIVTETLGKDADTSEGWGLLA